MRDLPSQNLPGLVYTNDKCIGCHRCISVCPVVTANQAVELESGSCRIEVDGSKCIACGACFDACEHHAREFRDDTERFFEDLERGERISVLWAPAFAANYPDEYERVLGGLKKKGAGHILSVSFGADITTWGYLNYIEKNEFFGGISQPCPAVVNYIEKFAPELISKLIPVHSPLMCGAVYLKKYRGVRDKLAFISPCIAKKTEIDDPNTGGLVSYNVAFDHLMAYAKKHNIFAEPFKSEIEYGLGAIYPMPGGLSENIRWFKGDDVFIRRTEGEKRAYHFLQDYKTRIISEKPLPYMVDALNCSRGCIYGTGVEEEKHFCDDIFYDLMEIKKQMRAAHKDGAWSESSPQKRLEALNRQFKDLDLNDFIRHYTDRSRECLIAEPSVKERNAIFQSMKKLSREKQNINCSACGYDTCRQMTTAVFNGCNHISNCVHYAKDLILEEREQKSEINSVLDELKSEVATSTSRTHYMESLYAEIERKVSEWIRTAGNAIDSGKYASAEALLQRLRDRGGEIIESIQDMLVSIRRTSRGLNLQEVVYSPETLLQESVQYVMKTASMRPNKVRVVSKKFPRALFGDKERILRVLNALLYEMKEISDRDVKLSVSAEKEGYSVSLCIKIEAEDEFCEDAVYNRFDEYLESFSVLELADDNEVSNTENEYENPNSMVDILLKHLFGKLKIIGTKGKGWVCSLQIPQVEPTGGEKR